jgi:hypothetical protein
MPLLFSALAMAGLEALEEDLGDVPLGELEDLQGGGHPLVPDEVEDLAGLVGRDADVLDLGPGRRAARWSWCRASSPPFFSWPAWMPERPGGANSPSLCPTIDSVM